MKNDSIDPKEYEINHELQLMFANSELPDVPLFDVEFFRQSREGMTIVGKQQFFFYQGKWRNTNPNSEFGAITFEKDEIRSKAYLP